MDEVRTEVWDVLFRAGTPKSISEIALETHQSPETIREVVSHDWFRVEDGMVTIAYSTNSKV